VVKKKDATILVGREEPLIETHEVVTGKVIVETTVETDEKTVESSLTETSVEVERVPMGREITDLPEVRTEGDLTIIPVVEEVLVVEKRLVLKEEIRVRRLSSTRDVSVPVVLRRQRAVVRREDPAKE
jgi:stress response protein YsnF